MRKSFSVYAGLLLFVIVFSYYYVIIQQDLNTPEHVLPTVFSKTGAVAEYQETYFWAKLADIGYNSLNELAKFAEEFTERLGMGKDGSLSRMETEEASYQEIRLNGKLDEEATAAFTFQNRRESGQNHIYIIVNVLDKSLRLMSRETREDVLNVFRYYGMEPSVNECIQGSIPGKLAAADIDGIGNLVLKAATANLVDEIREGDMRSLTAYTPSMGNFMKVGGEKVNLNFAIRYNPQEDKTMIWLATPLIMTEY